MKRLALALLMVFGMGYALGQADVAQEGMVCDVDQLPEEEGKVEVQTGEKTVMVYPSSDTIVWRDKYGNVKQALCPIDQRHLVEMLQWWASGHKGIEYDGYP